MNNLSDERDYLATRRKSLLTETDLNNNYEIIKQRYQGKKLLVIGGAGSIGSSFIYEIVKFLPYSIHIIDPNENGLTNLVRNLRSKDDKSSQIKLLTSPLDFGSKISDQFIIENGPYDDVFNFAAIKHVRSEKDIYSLMQMFDTNVIKHSNLLNLLEINNLTKSYFSVSTDKAANPVSLMGASKKIMELILQCKHFEFENQIRTSTTRFANVAFSNGSLLQSFAIRFEKREPLPAPLEIKRFFVSHKEAAQICILSSCKLSEGNILVPKINDSFKLYSIIDVAKNFIESKNFKPVLVESKEEAYKILDENSKNYPIITTKPDTSGEKGYEEFVGTGEVLIDSDFEYFDIVKHSDFNIEELIIFVNNFNLLLQGDISISKSDLVKNVKNIVKNLNHIETGENLDSRM
tara:strand:- start:232 stop:1449 length:1218 start_codon:yes stop_codon:yes gene_type:complete